jgi:hypothetical protein
MLGAHKKKRAISQRQPAFLVFLVGVQGFEPWTPWSQTRCATGLRHTPRNKIIPAGGGAVKVRSAYFLSNCKYAIAIFL